MVDFLVNMGKYTIHGSYVIDRTWNNLLIDTGNDWNMNEMQGYTTPFTVVATYTVPGRLMLRHKCIQYLQFIGNASVSKSSKYLLTKSFYCWGQKNISQLFGWYWNSRVNIPYVTSSLLSLSRGWTKMTSSTNLIAPLSLENWVVSIIFFIFSPASGKIPISTSIFFRWVGSTTN